MVGPPSSRFGDRWLWVACAVLAVSTLGARSSPLVSASDASVVAPAETPGPEGGLTPGTCPRGTAPDGEVCVSLAVVEDGPALEARSNAHRTRSGQWSTYEQIPRLPERPADYDRYRYPVPPGLSGGRHVASGYDLDQPDERQRRGARLKHVGHGAVDLPQAKGTPVRMIALEHQEGPAEVVFAGWLFGTTVITRHTLREAGHLRDYLMLFGHLDAIAPGVTPGTTVAEDGVVGAVGDSGSPGLVHLHLEVRRVREGVDLTNIPAGAAMLHESVSVVCDPRNVLPLR